MSLPVGILVLVGLGTSEDARGGGEGGSSRDGEKSGDGELHWCFWWACFVLREIWFGVMLKMGLVML